MAQMTLHTRLARKLTDEYQVPLSHSNEIVREYFGKGPGQFWHEAKESARLASGSECDLVTAKFKEILDNETIRLSIEPYPDGLAQFIAECIRLYPKKLCRMINDHNNRKTDRMEGL